VVHYLARHGDKECGEAAIISAVPPLMVKTPANPLGLPKSVFDDLQAQLAANRAKFYYDLPAGPVLRLSIARRENDRASHLELVAPGHDGRRQGGL
jgi:hypothetical protein